MRLRRCFPSRRSRPHPLLPGGLLALGCLATAAPAALALDSSVDYSDSRQSARASTGTFDTWFRKESATARQVIPLSEPLSLSLRFRLRRETSGSDGDGLDQESVRRIYQPDAALCYRSGRLDTGLEGNWLEQRAEGATSLAPEATRNQLGGWLNTDLATGTRITSSFSHTRSEERGDIGTDREQRQTTALLRAAQPLGDEWTAEYGLTGNSDDVVSRDTRRTFLIHSLELSGTPSLPDDRFDVFVLGRTQLHSQKVESGLSGSTTLQRPPIVASLTFDDTPLTLDPLEDDPVA
ncbi:MAG TPA: hypothetical protein VKU85_03150, partial [bacterium]|nr:hypothetical protein [bacterium]